MFKIITLLSLLPLTLIYSQDTSSNPGSFGITISTQGLGIGPLGIKYLLNSRVCLFSEILLGYENRTIHDYELDNQYIIGLNIGGNIFFSNVTEVSPYILISASIYNFGSNTSSTNNNLFMLNTGIGLELWINDHFAFSGEHSIYFEYWNYEYQEKDHNSNHLEKSFHIGQSKLILSYYF